MTEKELAIAVKLSCQRALLGEITPNIRLITIEWNDLKDLYFKVYYDAQPSEENIADMEIVIGEIFADIPFEKDHGAECVYDIRPINQLELYKWVAYARKE